MAPRGYTAEEMQSALDLVAQYGGKVYTAAMAVGIPHGTLQHRYRAGKAWKQGVRQPAAPAVPQGPLPSGTSYEAAWEAWDRTLGIRKARYKGPQTRQAAPGRTIVLLPDLHCPFHDQHLLADLVAETGKADLCVVMGDLMDCYATSKFVAYERVPFEDELAAAQQVLEVLSATYPEVVVIEGNHDSRIEKGLLERLPPDFVAAVRFLTGGELRPLAALCKRFENVRLATHQVGPHKASWFCQIGDLLVAHAEKYSRVPVSATRSVDEWFDDFTGTLGLKPWKVLAQAHTHQLSWVPWRTDRVLMEVGCACQEHGYQFRARIGGRPQRRGWVTLRQDEHGQTDLNSIKLVWWDARPGHEDRTGA